MTTRFHFDGSELRRRRVAIGKKPEYLAVGIDRSAEMVWLYEKGRVVPPVPIIFTLCELLDCQPGDLLRPVDDMLNDPEPTAARG